MTLSIPDEFDSNVGQLSGYTTVHGGFASWLNHSNVKVDNAAPSPETDNLTINLANKHVDIRSMIAADPDHGRPMSLMNLLHMMENAYHQSVNLVSGTATGGSWKLTWQMPDYTHLYALTTDYVIVQADSTHTTIARSGGSTITSGQTVVVSYVTSVGSFIDESHVLTGTTPVHLTHEADTVVAASIFVNNNSRTLTSGPIAWNANANTVRLALEAFIPQVIASLAYDAGRPAVTVTGDVFPYIITFQDETQPPDVREIGSWVSLFGIDYSSLTGSTPVLSVTNLRTDENWLKSASTAHLTMEEVETVAGSVNENWSGVDGSTGVTSVTVGRDADFHNWRSLKVVFDGSPVNLDLYSGTPLTPVNLAVLNSDRSLTNINFVVPEWTTGGYESAPKLNLANCWIQFTSDANGLFAFQGGPGIADSDQVFLDSNMNGTYFNAALSSFGADTDWSRVTGVVIHLESSGGNDPDADDVLTFLALRGLDNNWNPLNLDINTRTEHLEFPVPLDADPAGSPLVSPLIRSQAEYGATTNDVAPNVGTDPSLSDGAVSIKFNSGSQADAGGTEPTNHLIIYLRQRHNDDGSWDWIQAQLSWGKHTTKSMYIAVAKAATNAGGTVVTFTDKHVYVGTTLTDNTDFLFTADIEDDILNVRVANVDSNGDTVDFFVAPATETTDFERIRGRVGWYWQSTFDMDVELDYVRASNISFATFRSAVFHSRTPVDGAQLFVAASEPAQLFTEFGLINPATGAPTDDRMLADTVKKLSKISSVRFIGGGANIYSGIESNIIDFDDWSQMFIDFDVWMPASLSAHNNVQQVVIETTGVPAGGTFKLTHDGAETSALPWNVTAAQLQTALGALGTIGVGNVLCTGGPLGSGSPPTAIIIKFIDGLAGADVSTLTVTNNSITGTGTSVPVVTQVGVRPQIFLKEPGTEGDYTTGTIGPFNIPFVPGTWSHVHLDLAQLANHAINPHKVQILTQQPSTQSFWVDNMQVAHRSIAWEMRAIADGEWIPFLDVVNDPKGALHLPREVRGKALQLQARALRADSWISSYTIKPHYQELGRMIGLPSPTVDAGSAKVVAVISGTEIYTPGP